MNMGISVIIPLYNKADTIGRAIRSALDQDVEVEVVVIDDGSTDGSESVVRSFGNRVQYIRQENAGPSGARNRGAQASRFSVLTFLDADDELLPGCFRGHEACRLIRPDVKITISPSPRLEKVIGDRPQDFVSMGRFHYSTRFLYELATGIPPTAVCVDRDLFDEVNGFDTELHCWEVSDWMYRLVLRSGAVGILDKKYYMVHRNGANSQFAKTQADPAYRVRRVQKMLERIAELPPEGRERVLQSAKSTVKTLLSNGHISEAKAILRLAREHWPGYMAWGNLVNLPDPVIQGALSLRRALKVFVHKL